MSTPTSPTRVFSSNSSRPRPPSRPTSGSGLASASLSSATATTTAATTSATRELLYAQPASVHFGGFSLDPPPPSSLYTQRVFVHNNSAKSVRLQYTLPAPSPGIFRASFPQGRKPFLSPGLYEEVLVTFAPLAFQYYYDCLQIKCEEVAYASNADSALRGKLVVPLHAYPVINRVQFPTRMDFGSVPLGTTAHRHVELSCSVPIDFEYELRLVTPHAAFTVFPLRGAIPANSSTRIEVDFKPLQWATARAEVELHVSQLGFAPLRCVLAGSSSSDVTGDVAVSTGTSSSPTKRSQRSDRGPEPSPSPHAQSKHSPSSMTPTSPTKQTKRRADCQSEMVNGVVIPPDLSSHASVNLVLTQQPGKLKPKDLKKAIDANRAMRQQQKEDEAKLTLHATENNHKDEVVSPAVLSFQVLLRGEATAIEQISVSRQIREMFFLQELSEIETIEKELEFQSHKIRLGQELLTPDQLQILQQMRDLNTLSLERRERETLRNDCTTTAFHQFTHPMHATPYPPYGLLPAHFEPTIQPDFKTYKNDLWDRRKRVVQRLVRAISTVIIQHRAQVRLGKIQKWLGDSRTREAVRDKVAREWQLLALGGAGNLTTTGRNNSVIATSTEASRLFFESFPVVEEKDRRSREAIVLAPSDWEVATDPFTYFSVRERDEAEVAGHEPLELPPLATYVPLEKTRQLRSGALDECSSGLGEAESGSLMSFLPRQALTMPSTLELLPRDVFLRPSVAVLPLVRVNALRETLSWFPLRPQRVFRSTPRHWGLQLDMGVSSGTRSLRSLRTGLLRVSDRYQPCTERTRGPPPLLLCGQSDDLDRPREMADETELYKSVWDASDGFVPPMSTHADDVPCLSDSESDEDENKNEDVETEENAATAKTSRGRRAVAPTWEDAQRLWEDDINQSEDDGVAYEPGELLGEAQGITCFERYRHLIQSEREYNAYRDEKLQELPTLLSEVASKIHHPDYELVVDGHGPSRPLHEPFAFVSE